MPQEFKKHSGADKNYQIDWSVWLESGDTVATSTWVVPAGLTSSGDSKTTTTSEVQLAGGTHGVDYKVKCTITTANGHTEVDYIVVKVRDNV